MTLGATFTGSSPISGSGTSYNPNGALASAASGLAAQFFSFNNDHYNDAGSSSASSDQIIIRGANNSSITVNNEYINFDVSVAELGIDFGGNYELDGDEILHAILDIVGIVDQTGIADAINAGLYLDEGNYWDAVQSGAGVIPLVGDVAKINRIQKSYKGIEKAVEATGQIHHLIGKKITRALDRHPTLKGAFDYGRNNSKYKYKARDKDAHKGYEKWHREYENEVVDWLDNNPNATIEKFDNYLHNLHQEPGLKNRIPNVNLK